MRSLMAHALMLCVSAPWAAGAERPWLERLCERISPSLRRTDLRLDAIHAELPHLPDPPGVPSGAGGGFATIPMLPDQEQQWLEVILPRVETVDRLVLIPAVSMGAGRPNEGFGFPQRFVVEADAGEGTEVWTVMDHRAADFPNPGVYPVSQSFEPRPIRRVRLKVTKSWQEEAPSVLALAELMLLSGNRNLAVGARVQASSHRDATVAWRRSNLVDMSTPLGLPTMPAASATKGYHSRVEDGGDAEKSLTLKLPEGAHMDEIRLIPVVREGLPAWASYGYPPRMKIGVANAADFSDERVWFADTGKNNPAPGQNVVVIPGDGLPGQFVRITATRLWQRAQDFLFALAEVQVYSDGVNVARGVPCEATDVTEEDGWSVASLTDGDAHGERLVEFPEWFDLLAKRRELLAEEAALLEQRALQLPAAQDQLARLSGGLGAFLVLGGGLAVWRQKRRNRREQEQLRERLARDLHDDIGSNLGSISLLCNIVTRHPDDGASHHDDFVEIQRIASESADSMREMITLLSPHSKRGKGGDWLQVLENLAERQLRGIELHVDRQSDKVRVGPDLETRRELYLLCKEAFTNIARHARASEVRFGIQLDDNGLDIEIRDNGVGFDPKQPGGGFGLNNLRQRAGQMHGTLEIDSTDGTVVRLHLPRQRGWMPF